jgi:transcriptional regulator of heat shock response
MEKRQEKLLKLIVKEYVKTAEPISSQYLSEKYNLDICSATIRLDMAELTEGGYLLKPHTSSGRVPTEKAYRFFIRKISEPKLSQNTEKKIEKIFEKKEKENVAHDLGRFLSSTSKNVSLLFFGEEATWQGLSLLFSQPEFYDLHEILDFTRAFEDIFESLRMGVEMDFDDFFEEEEENDDDVKVFIGKEWII